MKVHEKDYGWLPTKMELGTHLRIAQMSMKI